MSWQSWQSAIDAKTAKSLLCAIESGMKTIDSRENILKRNLNNLTAQYEVRTRLLGREPDMTGGNQRHRDSTRNKSTWRSRQCSRARSILYSSCSKSRDGGDTECTLRQSCIYLHTYLQLNFLSMQPILPQIVSSFLPEQEISICAKKKLYIPEYI